MLAISDVNTGGVINLSSGYGRSEKNFAEEIIDSIDSKIQLKLGVYDIPNYEPYEFWRSVDKLLGLNDFKK